MLAKYKKVIIRVMEEKEAKNGLTKWRSYVSSDCLWIGTYVDNTADGSEIIMDIYKLSK